MIFLRMALPSNVFVFKEQALNDSTRVLAFFLHNQIHNVQRRSYYPFCNSYFQNGKLIVNLT